jgi:hypothetical protein
MIIWSSDVLRWRSIFYNQPKSIYTFYGQCLSIKSY